MDTEKSYPGADGRSPSRTSSHITPELLDQIQRLFDGMSNSRPRKEMAMLYAERLAHHPIHVVRSAFNYILDNSVKFPRIGDIQSVIRSQGNAPAAPAAGTVTEEERELLLKQPGQLNGPAVQRLWPEGAKTWKEVRRIQERRRQEAPSDRG